MGKEPIILIPRRKILYNSGLYSTIPDNPDKGLYCTRCSLGNMGIDCSVDGKMSLCEYLRIVFSEGTDVGKYYVLKKLKSKLSLFESSRIKRSYELSNICRKIDN